MIVIRDSKTFHFHFDWPKDVDNNLKHEIEFIIKSNEFLAENKIENEIEQLFSNIRMETIFMNTENSKKKDPLKFVLKLSQRLNWRSANKHVVLQNISIYYTWKK